MGSLSEGLGDAMVQTILASCRRAVALYLLAWITVLSQAGEGYLLNSWLKPAVVSETDLPNSEQ